MDADILAIASAALAAASAADSNLTDVAPAVTGPAALQLDPLLTPP